MPRLIAERLSGTTNCTASPCSANKALLGVLHFIRNRRGFNAARRKKVGPILHEILLFFIPLSALAPYRLAYTRYNSPLYWLKY